MGAENSQAGYFEKIEGLRELRQEGNKEHWHAVDGFANAKLEVGAVDRFTVSEHAAYCSAESSVHWQMNDDYMEVCFISRIDFI
ncbi:MAG: hypothetical protein K0Q94_2862, partial [Paenibacillus sp.]|nr:hypothetical protein [Paenibacillus sp.]